MTEDDDTPDPDPVWTDADEAAYREQQYYLGADHVEAEDDIDIPTPESVG